MSADYYIWINEHHEGPFSLRHILIKIDDGLIDGEVLGITEHHVNEEWVPLIQIPSIKLSLEISDAFKGILASYNPETEYLFRRDEILGVPRGYAYNYILEHAKSKMKYEVFHKNKSAATLFLRKKSLFSSEASIFIIFLPVSTTSCSMYY